MKIGIDTFGCDHARSGFGSYLISCIANIPSDLLDNFTQLKKKYQKSKKENKELKKELDSFNPVVFNDMIKGTVILYNKGDVE